jgi:hypothetical protein
MKILKKFNPIQRSYISKYHLDNLAMLPDHLMILMHLLLACQNKIIHFRKEMVEKVFGLPAGTKPFLLESCDAEINREVDEICNQYTKGKKYISVLNVKSILLGANSRLFSLGASYYYSSQQFCALQHTILCTPNICSLDIEEVYNLDFASLSLNNL